jgi:hypothetical protein
MAELDQFKRRILTMRKAFALLVVLGFFAFASAALAQSQNVPKAAPDPLVELLQSKGILTPAEAAMVSKASSPAEAQKTLAKLLLSKGLITQQEYNQTVQAYSSAPASAAALTPTAAAPATAQVVPAVLRGSGTGNAGSSGQTPLSKIAEILPRGNGTTDIAFGTIETTPAVPEPAPGPAVIPAFMPIRVLPVGLMGYESVPAVISAGAVRIQPYGFFKMNVIEDSSNPVGGDAVLSGMLAGALGTGGDIGPNPDPQFHLNARSSRFGANFEWLDPNHKLVVTGKIETDFEGNFTHVFNRNISTVRSSTLGLRLAFGRLDYHVSDRGGVFAEFGQDWTPFCSSTLPSSNETTLLGVEFGSCYERQMMARFGVVYDAGGSRHFMFQPEFAIAYPALGQPADTLLGAVSGQLSIGERTGADENRPEYQSRVVFQFQLDKAPGVAPAQLIASGMYGRGKTIIAGSSVPAAFHSAFPGGASTSFRTFGYSAEAQLPTRWFTVQAKWWAGEALRFFFVDNLRNTYNPTASFLAANPGGVVSAGVSGLGGESSAVFGCTTTLVGGVCPAGDAVFLPQLPVRGVGGFADLGIPLSRLFNANPKGRNAGWTLALGYGIDQSKVRDLRLATACSGSAPFTFSNCFSDSGPIFGAAPYKNDWGHATLNYKLNSWVLFGFEEGYYWTRALVGSAGPAATPLIINGEHVRSWHDLHEQISTIFFF